MGLIRPVRRVSAEIFHGRFSWWSRSQNHRDISFPNIFRRPIPESLHGSRSTADPIFEFVNGSFVVSFTAPSLSVRTVRKDLNRQTERFESNGPFEPKGKRDHKRAVHKFKNRVCRGRSTADTHGRFTRICRGSKEFPAHGRRISVLC